MKNKEMILHNIFTGRFLSVYCMLSCKITMMRGNYITYKFPCSQIVKIFKQEFFLMELLLLFFGLNALSDCLYVLFSLFQC